MALACCSVASRPAHTHLSGIHQTSTAQRCCVQQLTVHQQQQGAQRHRRCSLLPAAAASHPAAVATQLQQRKGQQQQQQQWRDVRRRVASSEEMQLVQRVAYQGVPGAYSEIAAKTACPDMTPLPCGQFEVAFQALDQWMADRAVLPIENSLGGSIHAVYDLMLRYKLHIVGEVGVPVNHCLLALPGVKKGDLKRVMSHPQALAQTDNYIRRLPGVTREAVDDTAGAAKMIAEQGWRDVAAIASRRAGELYGMDILDEGIQDMEDNVTRFLVLSRDPNISTDVAACSGRPYKTSIVFSMKEGPGMLFKALSVFALRDINLTKIESRPKRSEPLGRSSPSSSGEEGPFSPEGHAFCPRSFNYIFYVDIVGALYDTPCQNALRHLQEFSTFLRVLGSYPADVSI